MDKKNLDIKKIALTGVLMALVIISILFIKIPTFNGYVHIADSFILVSGVLGPFSAFIVGGVGALLSDIIVGYPAYAPWSLILHGFQGVIMALVLLKAKKMNYLLFFIAGSVISFFTVVLGYAIAEYVLFGTLATALSTIPFNIFQILVGSGIGTALYAVYKNFIEKRIAQNKDGEIK